MDRSRIGTTELAPKTCSAVCSSCWSIWLVRVISSTDHTTTPNRMMTVVRMKLYQTARRRRMDKVGGQVADGRWTTYQLSAIRHQLSAITPHGERIQRRAPYAGAGVRCRFRVFGAGSGRTLR